MAMKTMKTKLKFKTMYDTDARSPIDKEFDDGIIGTFVCWHNRYSLGHEHKYKDEEDFFKDLLSEYNPSKLEEIEDKYDRDIIDYYEYASIIKEVAENTEGLYILPLYLYDHSGITMNTTGFNCRWDSGQVGYVYTTKDELDRVGCSYNSSKDVEEFLISEVKVYDTYLRGEVFGYSLIEYDEDGHEEELDSCWGFYGDNMKENGMIDNMYVPDNFKIEDILTKGTDAYDYLELY